MTAYSGTPGRVDDAIEQRQRGNEERALLLHFRTALLVEDEAVLDRVDTRADRRARAEQALRVRRDLAPQRVRLRHRRGDLLVAEMLVFEAVALAHRAAGGPDLDHVGAVAHGLAYGLADVVGTVDDERHRRAAAQPCRGQVVDVAVTAGHRQPEVRRHRTRAEDGALVDRALDRNPVLGADVAHRREAVVEELARVGDGARAIEHPGLDGPHHGIRAAAAEEVHVRVDEAGDHRVAVGVDDPPVAPRGDRPLGPDGHDALAFDDDRLAAASGSSPTPLRIVPPRIITLTRRSCFSPLRQPR